MQFRASAVLVALIAAAGACGSDGSSAPNTAVTRVSVTSASPATDMLPGKTLQLTATASNAAGSVVANPGTFAWTSSATSVATVDQTGRVTGVTAGQTTIAVEVSGIRGTFALTVNPAAPAVKDTIFTPGLAFSPSYLEILVGATVIFAFESPTPHDLRFTTPGSPPDIPLVSRTYIPRTFNTKGTFHYFCPTHPEMIGDIVVK